MDNNIFYDCRWAKDADEKFIEDFCSVEKSVFKNDYSPSLFNKKFIKNIYGDSVVEVVYIDGEPAAARALWRNDILGKAAYQPGDTCVKDICRGKGIFTEMTKKSLELLSCDDIVYNFPNQNSFPGYMKMGWKLIKEYGFKLFTSNNEYLKEHPVKMDDEYALWWLNGVGGMFSMNNGKEYFLVRKLRKGCYRICACVSKEVAQKFPKKPFGLCFYRSEKKTFYNKKLGLPLRVVSKQDLEYIPVWKIDAI